MWPFVSAWGWGDKSPEHGVWKTGGENKGVWHLEVGEGPLERGSRKRWIDTLPEPWWPGSRFVFFQPIISMIHRPSVKSVMHNSPVLAVLWGIGSGSSKGRAGRRVVTAIRPDCTLDYSFQL